jgi:hypothetical protein
MASPKLVLPDEIRMIPDRQELTGRLPGASLQLLSL